MVGHFFFNLASYAPEILKKFSNWTICRRFFLNKRCRIALNITVTLKEVGGKRRNLIFCQGGGGAWKEVKIETKRKPRSNDDELCKFYGSNGNDSRNLPEITTEFLRYLLRVKLGECGMWHAEAS